MGLCLLLCSLQLLHCYPAPLFSRKVSSEKHLINHAKLDFSPFVRQTIYFQANNLAGFLKCPTICIALETATQGVRGRNAYHLIIAAFFHGKDTGLHFQLKLTVLFRSTPANKCLNYCIHVVDLILKFGLIFKRKAQLFPAFLLNCY